MSSHVCPWWGGYFIDNRLRRILHKPEKMLAPFVQRDMRVLDFGCGMGLFSIAMARLLGEDGCVVAVDVQQKMLDVLEKRAARAGVARRIRTHRCEPTALGLDGPIDFALAFWSVHEVPDPRALLADVHSCLIAGGKLLVAEPRGHVSAKTFKKMTATAQALGMNVENGPHVRLSRAVTLIKA